MKLPRYRIQPWEDVYKEKTDNINDRAWLNIVSMLVLNSYQSLTFSGFYSSHDFKGPETLR